jgi:hypothetical protein
LHVDFYALVSVAVCYVCLRGALICQDRHAL